LETIAEICREQRISVEDHLTDFLKFVDDLEVEHEDIVMKMLVQTLEGDAQTWYKTLLQLLPLMVGIHFLLTPIFSPLTPIFSPLKILRVKSQHALFWLAF
jgi:hypothetical protein